MKLSEILARVRDYPKLQRELEVAQKKAKEFEQKYEKAEKESLGFKYLWGKGVNELDRILENLPQEAWVQ